MILDIANAYNHWSAQYDSNENKTRDAEALVLKSILRGIDFQSCLELGCGTGKNSSWLKDQTPQLLAVDFSAQMLEKAREKISTDHVRFVQADITNEWTFTNGQVFDLAVCSLVLEHIEDLDTIFQKLAGCVAKGGHVYTGELHPFKQYAGSKARFENPDGSTQVVTCFTHHISDFITAGKKNGFDLVDLTEFFDAGDKTSIPRILGLLFRKN